LYTFYYDRERNMLRELKIILAGIAVLIGGDCLQAKTVIVPYEAATIQQGIHVAEDYDTVLVFPGNYIENLYLYDKPLAIIAEGAAEDIRIQPQDPDIPVLTSMVSLPPGANRSTGFETEFSGFTVSGGNDSPTIFIGGYSSLVIDGCIFHDNIPFKIYDQAVILCTDAEASPTVSRNVFYDNYGVTCVQVMEGAVSIINNTFDGNRSAFLSSSASCTAINNIIANCEGTAIDGLFVQLDFNDFWNNYIDYG